MKRWISIFLALMLLITVGIFAGGCSNGEGTFPAAIARQSPPSPTGMTEVSPPVNPSPGSSTGTSSTATPVRTSITAITPDPEMSSPEQTAAADLSGPPHADFSADVTDVDGPTRVEFSDLSTGRITRWQWDLNGDGTIDSTDQNPTFYFESNGDYSVTLTVSGSDGEDTLTRHDYIHVSGCGG